METLSILRVFNVVQHLNLQAFCVFNKTLVQTYLQFET
jgi:hypothetical protein